MSLVGNLEDLNLGDILQIVSLSRKSGTLRMRSGAQRGRIVLIEGQVRGGSVDGEPASLRDIIVDGGFLSEEEFKNAAEAAAVGGLPVEEVVAERASLDRERLESLRREQVESAVFLMLGWRTGEFNFEVQGEGEPVEAELLLDSGINAQYLAMEATRLGDEAPDPEPEAVEEPVFSGEGLAEPVPVSRDLDQVAVEPVAPSDPTEDEETASFPGSIEVTAAQSVPPAEVEVESGSEAPAEVELASEGDPAPVGSGLGAGSDAPPVASEIAAAADPPPPPPLVIVDPELLVVEWTKTALEGGFERIHGFQDVEAGIARVRQYLARLVKPVVLLGIESGTPRQVREWIARLQRLAPDMTVLLLCDGRRPFRRRTQAAAVIPRPPMHELANRRRWSKLEAQRAALRDAMVPWGGAAGRSAPEPPETAAATQRAERLCATLRDPARSGDVLSLVLDFAAESLSRVAIFMVRDGAAVGLAQRGLTRAGGPDDESLRELRIPLDRPTCLRKAIAQRTPQRGSPIDEGDRRLAEQLGQKLPTDMYLGPIESGGEVAALLYGDNLPEFRRIGDTGPLGRVLREAGRALDRALLERSRAPAKAAPRGRR